MSRLLLFSALNYLFSALSYLKTVFLLANNRILLLLTAKHVEEMRVIGKLFMLSLHNYKLTLLELGTLPIERL